MVTLVTLFIGRFYCLEPYLKGLEGLGYDKKLIHLVWHDTSHIRSFSEKLQEWIGKNGSKYASASYINCNKPHYHFEEQEGTKVLYAITEAYNHCRNYFKGDYLFSLEDDVVCPADSLKKLINILQVNPEAKAAAGRLLARPSNNWHKGKIVGWKFDRVEVFPGENIEWKYTERVIDYIKDEGLEEVGSCHLGCTLIDGDFARNNAFKTTSDGITSGCDVLLGYDILRQGKKYILDWGIHCKHYDVDGGYV